MAKKILLVDDDKDFLMFTKIILEKGGFEVVSANSGEDALSEAETLLPDLVLLDIEMPEMDGFAVALQLNTNEATKDIPIMMLTGKKDSTTISRSFDLNIVDYIMKPFDNQTLLKKIESILKRG